MSHDSVMPEENSFCTACGARIPPGTQFCPYCGADTKGEAQHPAGKKASDGLDTVRVLILLYGVVAAGFGALAILSGLALSEQMIQELIDQMKDVNPDAASILEGLDVASMKMSLFIEGGAILASGICALASSLLVKRKEKGSLAMILCVAASVLSIALFPLCIITVPVGLYMAYRVHQARDSFTM